VHHISCENRGWTSFRIVRVQAQIGHRSEQSTHQYAHLGSGPQRRLVVGIVGDQPRRRAEGLTPRVDGSECPSIHPPVWPAPDATATTSRVSLSGKKYRVEIEAWNDMLMKGKNKPVVIPMHQHPFTLVHVRLFNEQGELAFQRPLWLIVMGERRNELTLLDIFQAYQRRYDIEHFFRFGKQRLLLDRYQTPETGHEEKWWLMAHLAYLHRHPNSATALGNYSACRLTAPPSATHVQRDFERVIRQLGTPATAPKRRGNSSGRPKGTVFPPRPRPAVVYKGKNPT